MFLCAILFVKVFSLFVHVFVVGYSYYTSENLTNLMSYQTSYSHLLSGLPAVSGPLLHSECSKAEVQRVVNRLINDTAYHLLPCKGDI